MFFEGGAAPQQFEDTDVLTLHDEPYSLIVWNDEVNTFEWVIETLLKCVAIRQSKPSNALTLFILKANMLLKMAATTTSSKPSTLLPREV